MLLVFNKLLPSWSDLIKWINFEKDTLKKVRDYPKLEKKGKKNARDHSAFYVFLIQ